MKIRNDGKPLVLKRGAFNVRIISGVNILPEYDWLISVIEKNSNLTYISEVELTKTGTIKKKSKIVNKKKKRAKKND
jgi:hypothetical protein